MSEPIKTPNANDVLAGRGNKSNKHTGNVYLRALVAGQRDAYVRQSNPQKKVIVLRVIEQIENQNPPGRYLKQLNGVWYVMDEKEKRKKTAQALRDSDRTDNSTRNTDICESHFCGVRSPTIDQTVSPIADESEEQHQTLSPNGTINTIERPIQVNHGEVCDDKDTKQSQHPPDETQLSSLSCRVALVDRLRLGLGLSSKLCAGEDKDIMDGRDERYQTLPSDGIINYAGSKNEMQSSDDNMTDRSQTLPPEGNAANHGQWDHSPGNIHLSISQPRICLMNKLWSWSSRSLGFGADEDENDVMIDGSQTLPLDGNVSDVQFPPPVNYEKLDHSPGSMQLSSPQPRTGMMNTTLCSSSSRNLDFGADEDEDNSMTDGSQILPLDGHTMSWPRTDPMNSFWSLSSRSLGSGVDDDENDIMTDGSQTLPPDDNVSDDVNYEQLDQSTRSMQLLSLMHESLPSRSLGIGADEDKHDMEASDGENKDFNRSDVTDMSQSEETIYRKNTIANLRDNNTFITLSGRELEAFSEF